MPRKKTRDNTTHDRKVGRVASEYRRKGYDVQATTGRHPDPKPIGRSRRVPDIVAAKGHRMKIIEVETPRSLKTDRPQLETFARYAAKRKNVSFDIVVTKPRTKTKRTTKPSSSNRSRKR